MSIKVFKTALPYFELLCFMAAWVVGLSVAWTATRPMDGQKPADQIAASNLHDRDQVR